MASAKHIVKRLVEGIDDPESFDVTGHLDSPVARLAVTNGFVRSDRNDNEERWIKQLSNGKEAWLRTHPHSEYDKPFDGRFYTKGQFFMFEPAQEDNEPFLAHYTVEEVVNTLLETDEVDPKAYAMSMRRKRDIVQELVKKYAVRHTWQDFNRLLITFPKEIRFGIVLHNHGVPPARTIGVSGGSKNNRVVYFWADGDLDKLILPEPEDWQEKAKLNQREQPNQQ